MMTNAKGAVQLELFGQVDDQALSDIVGDEIRELLMNNVMPTPSELLNQLEKLGPDGWRVRWVLKRSVSQIRHDHTLTRAQREYLDTTLADEALDEALRAGVKLEQQFKGSIDELFQNSMTYRQSAKFQEFVSFAARFRQYAPFNNMLVRLQNPNCSFFATAKLWRDEFGCEVKEDAHPMVILAPMHPVMLVYDLDSIAEPPLPEMISRFAHSYGPWNVRLLKHLEENAARWGVQVQYKSLSSTQGGFVTLHQNAGRFKMRIVIHKALDGSSCYAVLCHEMAHVLLGHLGTDGDLWWPSRMDLTRETLEIEAESVSYIVQMRAGLISTSDAYLAAYLRDGRVPESVSLELIMKVAGKIEEMSKSKLPSPKHKKEGNKKAQQVAE
jgi:hypothetical protein